MILLAIGLGALILGALLARGARQLRWLGRGWANEPVVCSSQSESSPEPRERSLPQSVPPVGGLTLILILAFADWFGIVPCPLPWGALVGALMLGSWDDVRPLRVPFKLFGQLGVGLLLAAHTGSLGGGDLWALGGDLLLALVAQNLANTWDHADGLCAGWVLLLPGTPGVLRAALAGFLPLNLLRRGNPEADSRQALRPRAYLGDAGSHVLGILVAIQPGAWMALALPGLDLLRAIWLRRAAGHPFWLGDRRHLGHRLEAGGWHPAWALLALWPLWVLASGPLGVAAIFVSFVILLRFRPAAACTRATSRG